MAHRHPLIGNVRGVGLMAAIELVADKPSKRSFDPTFKVKDFLRMRAQEHGLIIRSALSGDSVAFSPPLIITEAQVEELIDELRQDYSVVIVTHSMQQAARVSQKTAFFHLGHLVEYGETDKIFTSPEDPRTESYITGRIG